MIAININSKKHGNVIFFIDGDDFHKVKKYKWHIIKQEECFRVQAKDNNKNIKLHRLIMDYPLGIIDHINGNTLDNRKDNLRVCSHQENCMNSKKPSNGLSSKYKGVTKINKLNKYRAYIKLNGKQINLGRFNSEDDAGLAYNIKAMELFGEFACLNKVEVNNVTEY